VRIPVRQVWQLGDVDGDAPGLVGSVPVHNVFCLFRKDGVKGNIAPVGRVGFNGYGHICDRRSEILGDDHFVC